MSPKRLHWNHTAPASHTSASSIAMKASIVSANLSTLIKAVVSGALKNRLSPPSAESGTIPCILEPMTHVGGEGASPKPATSQKAKMRHWPRVQLAGAYAKDAHIPSTKLRTNIGTTEIVGRLYHPGHQSSCELGARCYRGDVLVSTCATA